MNSNASTRIPHVIVSADPAEPGHVALINRHWTLSAKVEDAFVFPSALLAERWATRIAEEYAGSFEILPAQARKSHVDGEPQCRQCGCIETFACPDRCHWAAPGLCSTCATGGGQ